MSDPKPKNWPSKKTGMSSGKNRNNNFPKNSQSDDSKPAPKKNLSE